LDSCEIPQGLILEPILFIIITPDFMRIIESHGLLLHLFCAQPCSEDHRWRTALGAHQHKAWNGLLDELTSLQYIWDLIVTAVFNINVNRYDITGRMRAIKAVVSQVVGQQITIK